MISTFDELLQNVKEYIDSHLETESVFSTGHRPSYDLPEGAFDIRPSIMPYEELERDDNDLFSTDFGDDIEDAAFDFEVDEEDEEPYLAYTEDDLDIPFLQEHSRESRDSSSDSHYAEHKLNQMGLHLADDSDWEPEAPMAAASPAASRFDPTDERFILDESFAEAVLRMIDEKGMTDPQCYSRANLSRAVFNKLKQNALNPEKSEYRPSKDTALALSIGLALSLAEAKSLLEKAGYALSHSSKRDLIVEYFLMQGNHDIFELNEVLYRFHQLPLGSTI